MTAPSITEMIFLKRQLEKVQRDVGIILSSFWLKGIRSGKTSHDTQGLFYPVSKSIKIDASKIGSSFEAKLLLIHEYVHAVDHGNNYEISKIFLPEYIRALQILYKETKNKDFKLKTKKKVDYSNPDSFLSILPKNPHRIIKGVYNEFLIDHGYGYDYCLSNPEEFAAVTLEIFFTRPELLNDKLISICENVKERFFS